MGITHYGHNIEWIMFMSKLLIDVHAKVVHTEKCTLEEGSKSNMLELEDNDTAKTMIYEMGFKTCSCMKKKHSGIKKRDMF